MNPCIRLFFLSLTALGLFSSLLTASAPDLSGADWVIMVDGTQYTHETDTALRGVLDAIPRGQEVRILSAQHTLAFAADGEAAQTEAILNQVRPELFMGAHRLTELQAEAAPLVGDLSVPTIRQYLALRREFLNLYGQNHRSLWDRLGQTPFKKGCRIVLLVQKTEFPIHSRQDIQLMSEDVSLRNWVLEIQSATPFEQKSRAIKATCAQLGRQQNRVDTFYLNHEGNRAGAHEPSTAYGRNTQMEVSRALYSGFRALSEKTGGQNANGGSDPARIAQLLNT